MLICPLEQMEHEMEGIVWGITTVLLGVLAGLAAYWSVINFPGTSSTLLAIVGGVAMSAAVITSQFVRWSPGRARDQR
jgi:hypothetical protein